MPLPTFNTFEFNDDNFVTERITFKGYAERAVIRSNVNRREGVKLLATEFGGKEVTLQGVVIADSASDLRDKIDNMKKLLTEEEGNLEIESNRTFKATVESLVISDEHYNQSKAPWEVTFTCSKPFSEGSALTVITALPSGVFTFSGYVNISGTFFARPTLIYRPVDGDTAGSTDIKTMAVRHTPTGQTLTVSGFNSGLGLKYGTDISINTDNLTVLEGVTIIDSTGSFPRWQPGDNNYLVTVSGNHLGGVMELSYTPRYL